MTRRGWFATMVGLPVAAAAADPLSDEHARQEGEKKAAPTPGYGNLVMYYYERKGAHRWLAEALAELGETRILADGEIPPFVKWRYSAWQVTVRNGRIWWRSAAKAALVYDQAGDPLWFSEMRLPNAPSGYMISSAHPPFGKGDSWKF